MVTKQGQDQDSKHNLWVSSVSGATEYVVSHGLLELVNSFVNIACHSQAGCFEQIVYTCPSDPQFKTGICNI